MSEDKAIKSGGAVDDESVITETQEQKLTVDRPAEEYAKKLVDVSAENKKFRQKNSTMAQQLEEREKELKSLREEKLKEQGQWQKMYETEKSERTKLEEGLNKTKATFAFKVVTSAFSTEAAKAGCAKVDDLIKLATADGLINELEVSSEDYSITPESLKLVLEKAQKSYPYLYAKPTPGVRDGVPNGRTSTGTSQAKDLSTLKMEDLMAMAKNATN